MSRIRRFSMPFVLLLVVGAVAVTVPRVRAQEGQLAQPNAIPTLTLNYRDSQGAGTATITPLGEDTVSGGTRVSVQITQNGALYQGQGFVRDVAPLQNVIAFWVADSAGNVYFLSGRLDRGIAGWFGQGRYELTQNPSVSGEWSMQSAPCPVC
jgi:hypothetical protein